MKTHISAILILLTIASTLMAAGFGGIGLIIVNRKAADEPLHTGAAAPGSPAERAGVKAGWYLISIDGTNVMGMSLTQAVDSVRGPAGTSVALEFVDPVAHRTNKFSIKRANVTFSSNGLEFTDPK